MKSIRIRLGLAAVLLMTLLLSAPLSASAETAAVTTDNLVTRIGLSPLSPTILRFNQQITVSFSYNTTEAAGVRIYARPFTGTKPTPNGTSCKSPVYPMGAGTGSCSITVTKGGTVITSIRLVMWNAAHTTLLSAASIPVHYKYRNPANLLSSVTLGPPTPDIEPFAKNITVRFSYRTNQADGVRIFAVPFTGNSPTPNYQGFNSPTYPMGSGTGTSSFTVTTGAVTINRIRLQMWDSGQTTLLFQAFLPVNYQYTGSASLVSHIGFSPDIPTILPLGSNVNVRFSYQTNEPGGVLIEAQPFSGTTETANSVTCASPVYPTGTGNGTCLFTVSSGPTIVNKVRIQIWDSGHTNKLFEAFIPVFVRFR